MQKLRKRWLPLLIAALVIGGPVAWYKWPATASAASKRVQKNLSANSLATDRTLERRCESRLSECVGIISICVAR